MSVIQEPLFSDGALATPEALGATAKNVSLWLAGDLLAQLFASGEWANDDATQHPVASGSTPNDIGGAPARSYGFIGQGFRVTWGNSTSVIVLAGWGLQYDDGTGTVPSGESRVRALRLASPFNMSVTAATSGNYRRDLVVARWHDKVTQSSVQVLSESGNITTSTAGVLSAPDCSVGDAVRLVAGIENSNPLFAARPAVPDGYVAIAELLVSDSGLVNRAQNNASTAPGIRDLRPRLVARKAAGHVEARRASCSVDEGNASASPYRMGAKAVGEVCARGFVQVLTTSLAAYVVDDLHDWRDMMVEITHGPQLDTASPPAPGSSADNALRGTSNPVTGTASLASLHFYSGSGLTAGYSSDASKTASDGSGAQATFYADSTTGALMASARTSSGQAMLYIRAQGFGPLGKRNNTYREA